MRFPIIVSRLFEPIAVLSILVTLGAIRAGLVGRQLFWFLLTVAVIIVVPGVLFRLWVIKRFHADWDIADRKKRIVPLLVLMILFMGDMWVVARWGNPLLTGMFVIFSLWLIGFFFITLFWKISGHTSVLTLACLFLLSWYGAIILPLLLAIPLVAWARIEGKFHTLPQSIGGVIYSMLLFGSVRILR